MKGRVLLLLASLWGVVLAQGDPWAFVDEATRVHADEKTGYRHRNAVPCLQTSTKDFLSSCLGGFLRGPGEAPFYAGEAFSLGAGDRLELEAAFSSLEGATLFAQELMKAEVKGALESLYLSSALRSGSIGRWPLRVYLPQGKPKEMEGLCSLYAPSAALFSKVELFVYRGEGSSVNVFLVDMKGAGYTKATLVAFPKVQGSGFAWKGMYGEPFNRSFVQGYRRVMRTGAFSLCRFPKGGTE